MQIINRKRHKETWELFEMDEPDLDFVSVKLEETGLEEVAPRLVRLCCPFIDSTECEFQLVEDVALSTEDEVEGMTIAVAAHVVTEHIMDEEF